MFLPHILAWKGAAKKQNKKQKKKNCSRQVYLIFGVNTSGYGKQFCDMNTNGRGKQLKVTVPCSWRENKRLVKTAQLRYPYRSFDVKTSVRSKQQKKRIPCFAGITSIIMWCEKKKKKKKKRLQKTAQDSFTPVWL